MISQVILIGFILAFSVTSAILYILPIIIYGKVTADSVSRKKLDIFLKHVIGIMSVATAILSVIYFFMEYPPK